MKMQKIPVKRVPVSNGLICRLRAVIPKSKHRVSASSPALDAEAEESASRISRVLVILFLIHIVAIGGIFVQQRFFNGRKSSNPDTAKTGTAEVVPVMPTAAPRPNQARADLPRMAAGEKPYVVKTGDNYARIAASEGVDETNLRLLNKHVDISPGLILKIPPKRIVAVDPPEVTAIREKTPSDHNRGSVPMETTPVATATSSPPRARIAHPAATRESPPTTTAKATPGKSYVVQPGDSIWRIASRCKISEQSIMRANGISDAHKMRTGMKIVIPRG